MHIDQNKNKGFTLVELVIVVAILAILVGILAPAYSKYVERSAESTDLENVRTAYGEVMIAAEIEEEKDVLKVVPLKQKKQDGSHQIQCQLPESLIPMAIRIPIIGEVILLPVGYVKYPTILRKAYYLTGKVKMKTAVRSTFLISPRICKNR